MITLRLSEFCRSRHVSLSQLARWTGIARVSLSRYANGIQDITLGQLSKISAAMDCRLDDLTDDREDLSSPEWKALIEKASKSAHQQKDKSWVPRIAFAAFPQKGRKVRD
jgi:transcriptional regulator with XRE-family HTH domain